MLNAVTTTAQQQPGYCHPAAQQQKQQQRNHHRSQSEEAISSSSFLDHHHHTHIPSFPASSSSSSSSLPSSSSSTTSQKNDTASLVARPVRRTKLLGFTPTHAPAPAPVPAPALAPTPTTTMLHTASSSHSNTSSNSNSDPPLVPLQFRPSHLLKSTASDYPSTTSSHAADINEAFSSVPHHHQTAMVRKKSGELVRSSLKLGDMLSMSRIRQQHRSAPNSPTTSMVKIVHFDNARLEQVKPFLSRQRPEAVSRSGSPVETETEDEQLLPEASFPFPAMTTPEPGVVLTLLLPNFPAYVDLQQEACLEKVEIAADAKALRGIVRVQNLSFHKWVAVRYTMDDWCTVSEVSAEHFESLPQEPGTAGEGADRFVFSIRLQDLLARIEEKTMMIAVRYRIEGREIWDNNAGANYQIRFRKQASLSSTPTAAVPPALPLPSSSTGTTSSSSMMSSRKQAQWSGQAEALRRKLNLLVADDYDQDPTLSLPSSSSSSSSTASSSASSAPTSASSMLARSSAAEPANAFNTRYDFSTSSYSKSFTSTTSSASSSYPSSSFSSARTAINNADHHQHRGRSGFSSPAGSSSTSTTTYGSPIPQHSGGSALTHSPLFYSNSNTALPASSSNTSTPTATPATTPTPTPAAMTTAITTAAAAAAAYYASPPASSSSSAGSSHSECSSRSTSPTLASFAAYRPLVPSRSFHGNIGGNANTNSHAHGNGNGHANSNGNGNGNVSGNGTTKMGYEPLHLRRRLGSSPLASPGGSPPSATTTLEGLWRSSGSGSDEDGAFAGTEEGDEEEGGGRDGAAGLEAFLDRYCFHTSTSDLATTSLGLSNLLFDSHSPSSSSSFSASPSSSSLSHYAYASLPVTSAMKIPLMQQWSAREGAYLGAAEREAALAETSV